MPLLLGVARIPVLGDLLIRGCNAFAGLATRLAIHHHERMTADVRAGYLFPYDSWRNRIATLRFVQDIPTHPGHVSYQTLADIEEKLDLLADRPTLIVWGMRDWVFTPAFLRQWVRIYPRADVRRLNDAAHYVVEDARERIVPWMREFVADEQLVTR
jgi:cis-3-alkyl-4-acyloxetan-2-one decarboxylase